MERKKVAVIIAQADGSYQRTLIQGILNEANRLNIELCIFTNFHTTDLYPHLSKKHFGGERSIFRMIPYHEFDGIIVALETIRFFEDDRGWMEEEIHKNFSGPVISLDFNSKYFTDIIHDDSEAMKIMVEHLIQEHGYTDLAFLAGTKGHSHAEMRWKGYKKALEEYGIKYDESKVYQGNFWYDSGEKTAEMMIRTGTLPQVLICASESMAIGAYSVFVNNGIRVPEDIALTGFDAIDEGVEDNYNITSMIRDGETTGREAVQCLYEKMTGEKTEAVVEKPVPFVIWDSCGCKEDKFTFARNLSVDSLRPVNCGKYKNFFSNYNYMLESLLESDSFQYCVERLKTNLRYLEKFFQFRVCLVDDWIGKEKGDNSFSEKIYCEYLADGVTGECYANHERVISGEIVPSLDKGEDHRYVHYFVPIHFEGTVFGYSTLTYDKPQLFPDCYCSWMRNINVALEMNREKKEG